MPAALDCWHASVLLLWKSIVHCLCLPELLQSAAFAVSVALAPCTCRPMSCSVHASNLWHRMTTPCLHPIVFKGRCTSTQASKQACSRQAYRHACGHNMKHEAQHEGMVLSSLLDDHGHAYTSSCSTEAAVLVYVSGKLGLLLLRDVALEGSLLSGCMCFWMIPAYCKHHIRPLAHHVRVCPDSGRCILTELGISW